MIYCTSGAYVGTYAGHNLFIEDVTVFEEGGIITDDNGDRYVITNVRCGPGRYVSYNLKEIEPAAITRPTTSQLLNFIGY